MTKWNLKKTMFMLGISSLLIPTRPVWAASSHDRLSANTYQLADGTAITNVLARGIDISHWQGEINWQEVARNDIRFVMLGTRYQGEVDPQFDSNARGAVDAGLKLGAYIYSYAMTVEEAEAEADFILDLIKDYPISYPVAFDIEDNSQKSLDPTQISAMINAFCKKIADAGYYPLVYANDYWLSNKIDLSQLHYDVWVARYETQHIFERPVMWQVTNTGSVDGISGNVDINFQYQDFSGKLPADLWRLIDGNYYYYKNYVMQKNCWIMDQGIWYHLNADGIMSTGLIEDGGSYYFLRDSGAMATGWRMLDDSWYYFGGDGAMQTGWIGDDTAWYYLNPENGKMYANTQITVNDITYNVDENGVCHEITPEFAPELTPETPASEENPASGIESAVIGTSDKQAVATQS